MAKKKFLKISSPVQKDVTAMFNAVCERIAGKSQVEIKKTILDFKGTDDEIELDEPTIQDLIDVLHYYDVEIEFSLKASWTDFAVQDRQGEEKEPSLLCEVHKELVNKEKELITNPDLIEIVSKEIPPAPVFLVTDSQPSQIDPKSIPDFN